MILTICVTPALAFQETVYSTQTFTKTFISPNIYQYATTPENGLAWDVFADTDEKYDYGTGKEASFIKASHPIFSEALKNQDGKIIKMQGYMFPLEDNATQTKFLFGPFPMTCPFHYHVPPTLVIEAHAEKPIAFTYDPITLSGTLALVQNGTDTPYYRMLNAIAEPGGTSIITKDKPGKSFHPLFHTTPMAIRKETSDDSSKGDYTAQ